MRIRRDHNMSKSQAKDWIEGKLVDMLDEFGARVSDTSHAWDRDRLNFNFRVGGVVRFRGTLDVSEDQLDLNLPFPLLARGYERTAAAEINNWLDRNLPVP